MIQHESEKLKGLSVKLKSYLGDLEAAFAVFDAQEKDDILVARTDEERRAIQNHLVSLRAKVDN